jgi:hypothetical protein
LRTFALALAVPCIAVACSGGADAIDFADPLTGPVSPAFTIPFDSYSLAPAGLLRAHSPSGTENGIERPIVKTVSGNYLSRDFVFEIDVTIPADHGDIAFVGFGKAETSRVFNNEPTNAFLFRIHNLPRMPFYGIDVTVADPAGKEGPQGNFRVLDRMAEYTPGKPMRFQIAHQDGRVTMSLPAMPDKKRTFALADFPGLFDSREAHLFLANSSQGTTFTNASLRTP